MDHNKAWWNNQKLGVCHYSWILDKKNDNILRNPISTFLSTRIFQFSCFYIFVTLLGFSKIWRFIKFLRFSAYFIIFSSYLIIFFVISNILHYFFLIFSKVLQIPLHLFQMFSDFSQIFQLFLRFFHTFLNVFSNFFRFVRKLQLLKFHFFFRFSVIFKEFLYLAIFGYIHTFQNFVNYMKFLSWLDKRV